MKREVFCVPYTEAPALAKIPETGHLASWQLAFAICPLDCKYSFSSFRKNAHRIDYLYGERGGGCEREGMGVNGLVIIINIIYSGGHSRK